MTTRLVRPVGSVEMDFTFKPRPFSFEVEFRHANTKRVARGIRYIENLSGYIWDLPNV